MASATTTSLSIAPNPAVYGNKVTLTAKVKASNAGTPTGTVTFLDGATRIGSSPVGSSGGASLATSTLAAGAHSLTADYSGDTNYTSSKSAARSETVTKAATTTALKSSAASSGYGESVTFTATVKPGFAGTPGGAVTFLSDGTSMGTGTLSHGVATFASDRLAVGTHSITAAYGGSADYQAGTSAAISQVINVEPTTLALKSSPNPSTYGESVTFTATVKSAAVLSPSGSLAFLANGKSLGSGRLANGVAKFKTTALAVGTNSITATFAGGAGFKASSSAAVSQVTHAEATTTTLTSSANPSTVGESVTFTATVKAGAGVPGGKVTFKDGPTALGTENLSGGTAALTTTTLAEGTHSISAIFDGSTDYLTGTSTDLTQTVNAATASRAVYVPDYYGSLLQVRVGTGTPVAITIDLPGCNPNSVAVNSNKAYVVCNADGGNPDKILVYDAATIRSAPAGTLSISPLQTITSNQFNSLIGVAFDASNNLWVASYGNNQVDEITSAELSAATPTVTASLIQSPDAPVALAFDKDGSLWVSGQYDGGILVNFPSSQFGKGVNAAPDYCLATANVGPGCQVVNGVFLNPEGLALFNGDVWVSNNSTGAGGNVPARELIDLKYAAGSLTVNATFGSSTNAAKSPFVCPGGLFAGSVHLWINDESYGETNPQCGAAGDVASMTGGVFDFTAAQLAAQTTTASQVLAYSNITGRPGFGGVFVENDQ